MNEVGALVIFLSIIGGLAIGYFFAFKFKGFDRKRDKVLNNPTLLVEKLQNCVDETSGGCAKKLIYNVEVDPKTGKEIVTEKEEKIPQNKRIEKKIEKQNKKAVKKKTSKKKVVKK